MNPLTKEISALQNRPEDVFVVHCSHGATNNVRHFYPRIICIYVQNANGSESKKFSIENLAIKQKVPIEDIADWYDELELNLLDEFDEFLRSKTDCVFVYWAEENQELVLDAIKSRFEELNREENRIFCSVPSGNRKSVHFMVSKIDQSAPRELKLFIKAYNRQTLVPGFLSTAEEQGCFDRKDFGKVGTSVVAKVSFFIRIINEFSNLSQTSNANIVLSGGDSVDIEAMNPMQLFKKLTLGSWLVILGLIGGAFSIGYGLKSNPDSEILNESSKSRMKVESDLRLTSDSLNVQGQRLSDSIHTLQKEKEKLEMQVKDVSDSVQRFRGNNLPGKKNRP